MKYFIFLLITALISVFAIRAAVFSDSGFVNETVQIKDKNRDVFATVYFGTPIKKNIINGWLDKKTMTVFSAPDGQLPYVTINDQKLIKYTGKPKKGYYPVDFDMDGADVKLAKSLPEILKPYEKKYYDNCATCHTAYDVKRYTLRQWKGILITMKPHTSLSDDDMGSLFRYIKLVVLAS